MRCVAYSNDYPNTITVERREEIRDIWVRLNPRKIEAEEHEEWEYDEAYMQSYEDPETLDPEILFDIASEWEPKKEPTLEETVSILESALKALLGVKE